MSDSQDTGLKTVLDQVDRAMDRTLTGHEPELEARSLGTVSFIGPGVARVRGMEGVRNEELLEFPGNRLGMAFNIDPREIGVIMLDDSEGVSAGNDVRRTGRILDTPVGDELLGRVIDPMGRPLDGRGALGTSEKRPVERPAPAIMDRAPVTVPLMTGLKVIDALIPVGRGQRELILGDRQTGKTAIALDTIVNQHDKDVICIYCAVGKRGSAVAKAVSALRERGALDYSLVISTTEEDPPGLQYTAPYAAATIGEHFMQQGRDVLVVYDDLTRHARAYRELSLLQRRPPGREAFPGDIFYVHSRLLERATHLRKEHGGGSLTALPIVETEAQNLSAYIPTNLISITDGQIYLSPQLFQRGILPAVDVGTSVSRVGGKTQLKAYRIVAGDLRLSYSQFEELESFSRFGTQLDDETKNRLERGRRVREVLKQPQFSPRTAAEQVAVLVAVNRGYLDSVAIDDITEAQRLVREAVTSELPEICDRILQNETLEDDDLNTLGETITRALAPLVPEEDKD
ncbi:alternate F1F0 ATPase, F1 subunit alpha [Salidesulfovibrio brasiliensis]|uniref:alternate F1F0 ATPase, F1 subunit alpha n=1 Tax=Salidesulfovibrio brasiliensis TaxID=221711 RepID=UPI000B2C7B24|nr:alternate F1F0 ATPase, F1 subunit alpha [Salidesulfovibrio brasiliensis]